MAIIETITAISTLLSRWIPNKTEQERQKMAREMLELTQSFELAKGQLEVNKVEAEHPNLFVSGWRPFIGWGLGVILILQVGLIPVVNWIILVFGGSAIPSPNALTPEVWGLISGLLGINVIARSVEKFKGK